MADGRIVIDTKIDSTGVEKGVKVLGGKLGGIAKTGLTSFTAAVATAGTALLGVGVAATKVGMDFEAQMSRVKAISGATGEAFERLKKQAMELGASTAFSAKEVAEGMENLASAGFDTNEIMSAMPGMLDLAASSGEDLASSSEIAASTLRGFGLEAAQAGHVADVLAKNAADTNAAIIDTGYAMKYIAPVARNAGWSLESVTAAIGAMADAGIKGEQAGTTLRGALTRLIKPAKPAREAMKAIGFSAYDASGKMKPLSQMITELNDKTKDLTAEQRNQYIAQIFGTEALSGMTVLMQKGGAELDKMTESLKNSDGAAAEMAKTMKDNLKGSVEELGGALETLAIEFYESVNNPMKDIVKTASEMVQQLSKAFRENGMTGLVSELGTVLSQIIINIAEGTPKIVDGAINLISSFISGIENNLPKIMDAGVKIITSLIDGAVKILPQVANLAIKITEMLVKNLFGSKVSNAFKGFVNEAKKCFEEVRNTVEKAVNKMVIVLGKLIKILSNIGRVILPVVTKAFKFLGDNLDTIIPLITAVYTGFKAYSILSATTGLITTMTTAWKAATVALAAHEAASRLTLVALNGALPISTMLIGVLTGKITLATAAQAAWNAVMSVNPLVLVLTAVAALTAGLVAYNLMQKDVVTGEERLNEANEALANSYTKIGEASASFYNGIKNATGILDGFNDSIIVSNDEQQNLSTRMDEVQGEITQIARTATEQRRALTQTEIQRLDELFAEMQKLTQRELEIQQAYQQVVQDRAKVLADTHTGTLAEYQTYAQNLIASAEETRAQVIAKANEQSTEEIALINAKYEAMGQKGSEAYNKELEAANNRYTSAVEAANKECGDTLSIVQEGYANRAKALQEYSAKHNELQKQEQEANAKYNAALEEEEKRYNSSVSSFWGESVNEDRRHKDTQQAIEEQHKNEIARIREEELKNLNHNVIEQGGALITMTGNTELYGGKITDETRQMCNGIIDNLDNLPDGTRDSMEKAMSPMLSEMNKAEPGLFKKATNIANGILNRLRRAFDEHSPSRETRKIFKYVMQGAELGMDDETSNLYEQTDDVAKGVLERFNATRFNVSSLASKMTATVYHEQARTTTGVIARNGYGVSGVDNMSTTKRNDNPIVVHAHLNVDGKEFTQTVVAPNQGVLEDYYKGR